MFEALHFDLLHHTQVTKERSNIKLCWQLNQTCIVLLPGKIARSQWIVKRNLVAHTQWPPAWQWRAKLCAKKATFHPGSLAHARMIWCDTPLHHALTHKKSLVIQPTNHSNLPNYSARGF